MLARMTLVISCFALGGSTMAAVNPIPSVDNPLAPSSTAPGSAQLELTVTGAGFMSGSVVQWNGSPRATTFQSDHEVTATIPATDLAAATSAFVTVVNPAPGGGRSNVAYFQVVSPRATLSFVKKADYVSGVGSFSEPFNLITSDFNLDGKLDLAVANVGDSTVSVFLGKGDGTFRPQVTYAAEFAISLAAADFDGDGIQDLAVTDNGNVNGGPGKVLLMLGHRDGTFDAPVAAPAGLGPYAIDVGDFNRDGKLDAVVADYATGGDSISVLLGKGNGTFRPRVSYATGAFPQHVRTGDLNADGLLDLIVSVRGGSAAVAVFLGNGDGTFGPRTDIPFAGSPIWSALGDVNRDGALDVATVDAFDSSVAVMAGNGDGTFGSPAKYATERYAVNVAVGIADLNGDDVQDLAVNTGQGVGLFLGQPSGTFVRDDRLDEGNVQGMAIGDFNRDGRPDLAVVGWASNSITVWVQAP
jgi:hypothetical protein